MRFLTLSNLATLLLSIYSHPFYRQEIADLQQLLHMKDRYVLLKMSRVVAPLPLFVSEELSNTFPAFRWYLGEPGVLFRFLMLSSGFSDVLIKLLLPFFFRVTLDSQTWHFRLWFWWYIAVPKMLHLVAFTRQGVPYCCTQGATTLLHPACNRSKVCFPAKTISYYFCYI